MAMVVLVCLALLVVTTVIHYEVLRGLTVLLPGLGIKPRAKLIVVIIAAFLAHALEIALYALAIWGLDDMGAAFKKGKPSLSELFDEDMLGDDLEAWLNESFLLKRTFRNCAVIAGLIDQRHPGKEKTGRQVTVSADLIYDVLRSHEPDHILLEATRNDAATGLLDIGRLGDMLMRIKSHIRHQRLDRVSPLAVPIMLEIGRETVAGDAQDVLLAEAADELMNEIMAGH